MTALIRAQNETVNALLPQRMRVKLSSAPYPFTVTNAPLTAPGNAGSHVDLPLPRSGQFEGDIGIKELRHRLSLDPGMIPEPRIQTRQKYGGLRKALLSLAVTIVAVVGVLVITFREETGRLSNATMILSNYLFHTQALPSPARLVVENQKGFINEPLPLRILVNGASGSEIVMLAGLVPGSEISVGTRLGLTGWQFSAHDLGTAVAHSPKGFVGVMDVMIDLRSASDRLLDNKLVQLTWVQKGGGFTPDPGRSKPPSAFQRLDPELTATLELLLKNGDILSARILLKRAASTGNAEIALKLGMTFDPVFLVEMGVLGFAPDVAQARAWYVRAMELGSVEATRRLERLALEEIRRAAYDMR